MPPQSDNIYFPAIPLFCTMMYHAVLNNPHLQIFTLYTDYTKRNNLKELFETKYTYFYCTTSQFSLQTKSLEKI